MPRIKTGYSLREKREPFPLFAFALFGFFLFPIMAIQAQVMPVRGASGDLWADVVLGQTDFGGTNLHATNQSLFRAKGVYVDTKSNPQRLYVYDGGNNRVLGFSDINIAITRQGGQLGIDLCLGADSQALPIGADMVLGQPDFNHTAGNGDSNFQQYPNTPQNLLFYVPTPTAQTLCLTGWNYANSLGEGGTAGTMATDSAGDLYVTDYSNNRVVRYENSSLVPGAQNVSASYVWGQPDAFSCKANQGLGGPTSFTLSFLAGGGPGAAGVAVDPWNNLWVADCGNNRVLRFPNNGVAPTTLGADVFLGQVDSSSTTTTTMIGPGSVRVDYKGDVFVYDNTSSSSSSNSRILLFENHGTGMSSPASSDYNPVTADLIIPIVPGNTKGIEIDPTVSHPYVGLWVNNTNSNAVQYLFNVSGNPVTYGPNKYLLVASDGGTIVHANYPPTDFNYLYPPGNTVKMVYSMAGNEGGVGVDRDGNVFISSRETGDVYRFPHPRPISGPHALPPYVATAPDVDLFKQKSSVGTSNNTISPSTTAGAGLAVACASGVTQLITSDTRINYWNLNYSNSSLGLFNYKKPDGYAATTPAHYLIPGTNGPGFGRITADPQPPSGGSTIPQYLWVVRGGAPPVIEAYKLPLTTWAQAVTTLTDSSITVLGSGGAITWGARLDGISSDPTGHYLWLTDTNNYRVFRIRNPATTPQVDVILGEPDATSCGCNYGGYPATVVSGGATYHCSNYGYNGKGFWQPGSVVVDQAGNVFVSDFALEFSGSRRLMEFDNTTFASALTETTYLAGPITATRIYDQYNSYTFNPIPNPYDDPADGLAELEAPLEPAIRWDEQVMVVGNMGGDAANARWPLAFFNPVSACPNSPQVPATVMNDFQSLVGFSSAFDPAGNLFLSDTNRNRVLAYWQPFPSMVPTSICVNTLTITPTITLTPTPSKTWTMTYSPTYTPTFVPTVTPTWTITPSPSPTCDYCLILQPLINGVGGVSFNGPWGVAIDSSGSGTMYVADNANFQIQKFNLNMTTSQTISPGNAPITNISTPWGIDFFNNYIYVAAGNNWLMINPATNGVSLSMPVSSQAIGLSVDKTNGDVYVTGKSTGVQAFQASVSGSVTTYVPATTNLPTTFTSQLGGVLSNSPSTGVTELFVGGGLYTTSPYVDQFRKTWESQYPASASISFSPVTVAVNAATLGGINGQPYQMAVDGQGRLYVGGFENNLIQVFDINPNTGAVTAFDHKCSFGEPMGMAFDGWGNLYMSTGGTYQVDKIANCGPPITPTWTNTPTPIPTCNNCQLSQAVTAGSGGLFNAPYGEAIDPVNGILYVADSGQSQVQEFNLNGGTTITNRAGLITGLTAPFGMDFYNGYLYVGEYGHWLKINPATNGVSFSTTVSGQAVGLSVDKSNGDVYVTDNSGVKVFPQTILSGSVTYYGPQTLLAAASLGGVLLNWTSAVTALYVGGGLYGPNPYVNMYTEQSRTNFNGGITLSFSGPTAVVTPSTMYNNAITQYGEPYQMAADNNKNLLYLAGYFNTWVQVFDINTSSSSPGTLTWDHNCTLGEPVGVALDVSGNNLYVARRNSDQVDQIPLCGLPIPTSTHTTTWTWTQSPTRTPTITPTWTMTYSPTWTPTVTPTYTPTYTPTATSTFTPSNTFTDVITDTPVFSYTPTLSPTPTPITTACGSPGFLMDAQPWGVAYDANGFIYVANQANGLVDVFNYSLPVPLVAEIGSGYLTEPVGVALDAMGNVYVTDESQNMVYVFNPPNIPGAGTPNPGAADSGAPITQWGGPGTILGQFNYPQGIAVYTGSSATTVYVADQENSRIQAFSGNGTIINLGSAITAPGTIVSPEGVAVDGSGNVYVADNDTGLVQVFDSLGANQLQSWDATAGTGLESAEFVAVNGNCSGGTTQVLVSDGYGSVGAYGIGASVTVLGSIVVPDIDLSDTEGLAISPNSWMVADLGNDQVDHYVLCSWMCQSNIPTPGTFTYTPSPSPTVALTPTPLSVCSSAVSWMTVGEPWAVALDSAGKVYVTSSNGVSGVAGNTVDILNPLTGILTGQISAGGQFPNPRGVAVDGNNYVYVTDQDTDQVYVYKNGPVTSWGAPGRIAGEFEEPEGIAVYTGSSATTVYVADQDNQRIQAFSSFGNFITQWGIPGTTGNGTLSSPQGVAVDGYGNVYVTDNDTGLVHVFTGQGVPVTQWDATEGTGLETAEYIAVGQACSDGTTQVLVTDGFNSVGVFGVNLNLSNPVSVEGTYTLGNDNSDIEGIAVGYGGWYVVDWGNGQVDSLGSCPWLCTVPSSTPTPTWTPTQTYTPTFTYTTDPTPTWTPTSTTTWTATPTCDYCQVAQAVSVNSGGISFNGPWGVAVDSSANSGVTGVLYVSDFANSRIQKFNLNNGVMITSGSAPLTLPNGLKPWGMDFYKNNLYVAVYGAWLEIDPATNNIAVSMAVSGQAVGISVDKSNGDVYVTDSVSVKVFQYTQFGQSGPYTLATTNLPTFASDLGGVLWNKTAGGVTELFVGGGLHTSNPYIDQFTKQSETWPPWPPNGTVSFSSVTVAASATIMGTTADPYQMAVDNQGRLYVGEFENNNELQVFDINSNTGAVTALDHTCTFGNGPIGVAFDGWGNLYMSTGGTYQVDKISNCGPPITPTWTWTPTNSYTPSFTFTTDPTPTWTATQSYTQTFTYTTDPTPSWTPTNSSTWTPTSTPTWTPTPTCDYCQVSQAVTGLGFSGPWGEAIDSSGGGTLYVSDFGLDRIQEFNLNMNASQTISSGNAPISLPSMGYHSPWGMDFYKNNLYVAVNGAWLEINPVSNSVVTFGAVSGQATGLSVDQTNGDVYVTDNTGVKVFPQTVVSGVTIYYAAQTISAAVSLGGVLINPTASVTALYVGGGLYGSTPYLNLYKKQSETYSSGSISVSFSGPTTVVTPSTMYNSSVTQFGDPYQMAVNNNQHLLYLAGYQNSWLQVFDINTSPNSPGTLTWDHNCTFAEPIGVAFDGWGNLYVSDRNSSDQVDKITNCGQQITPTLTITNTMTWSLTPTQTPLCQSGQGGYAWAPGSTGTPINGPSMSYNGNMWIINSNGVYSSSNGINWSPLGSQTFLTGRTGQQCTVYNGTMWVMGGRFNGTQVNDVYTSSNGVSWTSLGSANVTLGVVMSYGGSMWNIISNGTTTSVYSSTDGLHWSQVTSAASFGPRGSFASMVFNGYMWVIGGTDGSNYFNDVYYSSDGAHWTEATASAGFVGRSALVGAACGDLMWIMGGGDPGGPDKDVWVSADGAHWNETNIATPFTINQGVGSALSFNSNVWVLGTLNSGNNWTWSSGCCEVPTLTSTSTPTGTPTKSYTPSFTFTPDPTPTWTATLSYTPTFTFTTDPTPTWTATSSYTPTFTYTTDPTPSWTGTNSFTPTFTFTTDPTPSWTPTKTWSPSNTPTVNTPTKTPTVNTPTKTWTPTNTPTVNTPTKTNTPTVNTPTKTPTVNTPTKTWTPSNTPTVNTPTKTNTPTVNTPTKTPTVNTPTKTWTPSNTPTVNTPTKTSTPTVNTPTKTWTPTITRTFTTTATKTITATSTKTYTPTVTPTKTATGTPTHVGAAPGMMSSLKDNEPTVTPTPTLTPTLSPELERGLLPSVVAAPNISRDMEPIEFRVQLTQPAQMNLTLYDLLGEKIFQVSAAGITGLNTLEWDSVNSGGNRVASGLYIYVLEVDGASGKTNRMGRVVVLH